MHENTCTPAIGPKQNAQQFHILQALKKNRPNFSSQQRRTLQVANCLICI
jgi:hypothetical protein